MENIERNGLGTIEIVDYDPKWPIHYAEESDHLLDVARGKFLRIEHFGSTSVPGLRAKNVIDIMASVNALDDLAVMHLGESGYEEMVGSFARRRFFWKAASIGRPSFHLHVVDERAWRDKSERLFRDWLISHPTVSDEYGRLKDNLAIRFSDNREAYTDAKGEFICAVVNEARQRLGLAPLSDWEE